MAKWTKTLGRVLRGTSDTNIRFLDLCDLLRHLGFMERVRGDHHIFVRKDIEEILNIQPKGSQAKAYQVRQARNIIIRYCLPEETDEDAD